MKKLTERFAALAPAERRRVLQLLGVILAAPAVPAAARFAARALCVGEARAQQMQETTLFLELGFREQVDLMHVMVPPSIAKYPNRSVGVNGEELSMFAPQSELKEFPNNVFLTNDSLELAPHIDSVAMLDTGEPGIGNIHGHEAGNGMRSPGRIMDGGASGLPPIYLNDTTNPAAGNEALYGSAPTPASFHNYCQKKLGSQALNGLAFKGNARGRNKVYHYGAGYPEAELTRVLSKKELFAQYGANFSLTPQGHESALVDAILAQAAVPYRKEAGAGYDAMAARFANLHAQAIDQLELTVAEAARWSEGVPAQKCTVGDVTVMDCPPDEGNPYVEYGVKAQIWEQFGYASKLFRAGRARSIALEFDFMDLTGDGTRPESVLRAQAQQVARPLARLIADLKAAGLYERTVLAVYTLDGSRRPAANSYGDDGKGTILLAGGRIKGGYYGDITIESDLPTSGHSYGFRAPDPTTGNLLPVVTDWHDKLKRTPSGSVWRTVMKALGIAESEYVGKFNSQIDDAVALDFMLKA